MKAKLLYDLWRFPPCRDALKKEVLHFFLGSALGLTLVAFVRWQLGLSYTRDGLIALSLGIIAATLLWLVSLIRTIRAVLREHGLLER